MISIRDQLEQMIRPYVETFFEGKRKRHEQDEQLKPKIEYLLSKKNSKLICNLFLTRYDIELMQPRTDSMDNVLYLSNNVIVEFYYENDDYYDYTIIIILKIKYDENCDVSTKNLGELVSLESISVKAVFAEDKVIENVENKIDEFQQMLNQNRQSMNLEIESDEALTIINTIKDIFNDNSLNVDIHFFMFSFLNWLRR